MMTEYLANTSERKKIWAMIFAYVLATAILLIAKAGTILLICFPLTSLLLGIYLYLHAPDLYVGFTLWLWLFGPLVRRILQLQTGDPGGLTVVPMIVTAISAITFIRHLPSSFRKGGIPFFLCFASISYVTMIGFFQNPIGILYQHVMTWTAPIFLSFHLFHDWRRFPQYSSIIQQTFLWGTLIMGIYGVFQFVFAPPWDTNWLIANDIVTRGRPEAFAIRVWSTTEDSRTFGGIMMASLIFTLSNKMSKFIYFPALSFGSIALLLSSVRSAWLGLVLGLSIYFISLKAKLQIRLILILCALGLVMIGLTSFEEISDAVINRISSFSNLGDDFSYQHRAEQFRILFEQAISEIMGKGFGFSPKTGLDIALSAGDNNLLAILFWFGWIGAIPYFAGIALLSIMLLSLSNHEKNTFILSMKSVVAATLPLIIGLPIFDGSLGLILWICLGMGLAAYQYQTFSTPNWQTSDGDNPIYLDSA